MIKLKVKATREKYDGYSELNSLHSYSSCANRDENGYCMMLMHGMHTVLHMMNMREDYIIHNTHRTFRAWFLPFSFIIGQP